MKSLSEEEDGDVTQITLEGLRAVLEIFVQFTEAELSKFSRAITENLQ
jgi:hypothetical protein